MGLAETPIQHGLTGSRLGVSALTISRYKAAGDSRFVLQVEMDLDLNAYANARAHYENRKAKAAKQQKTVEQNAKALLAAEKTAQLKLTQVGFPAFY